VEEGKGDGATQVAVETTEQKNISGLYHHFVWDAPRLSSIFVRQNETWQVSVAFSSSRALTRNRLMSVKAAQDLDIKAKLCLFH